MNESAESVRLEITDVAYRGRGLGRHDGKVVFVAGTLPGEAVEAVVIRHHKNFSEARLTAIHHASPQRIEPACPLAVRAAAGEGGAAFCPGCCYQHAAYPLELSLKQAQLSGFLKRMAGVDPAVCAEPVPSPEPLGYRNKIVLHGASREGGGVLGYFAEDNATVLDVPACPLAHPEIQARLSALRADPAFMARLRDNFLLALRWTPRDGVVHWTGQKPAAESFLTVTTALGEIRVPRGSFFQVNAAVADRLIVHVQETLGRLAPESAVDLYSGVGMFAFAAVRAGVRSVTGVEVDAAAVAAARAHAEAQALAGVEFVAEPAARAAGPVLRGMNPARTVVIVDPPRRGLDPKVLKALVRSRPAHILYVSCAADTLARDIVALKPSGYAVASARLFDMFPRTPYFETAVLLSAR